MNIFATSPDPIASAQALDDKRVGSQLREAAALLCGCPDYHGRKPYKTYNSNHPCQKWVNASIDNRWWLIQHFRALSDEWKTRFNKEHGSATAMFIFAINCADVSLNDPASFYNGAKRTDRGIDFTNVVDVHEAYKLYLNARWGSDIRIPRWTNRQPPKWSIFA